MRIEIHNEEGEFVDAYDGDADPVAIGSWVLNTVENEPGTTFSLDLEVEG